MNISVVGRITGSEMYYPVRKDIKTGIERINIEPIEPNLLLVSNRPEQVDKDGVLLSYTLTPKEPSRLDGTATLTPPTKTNLWVNLYNPSNEEASVLVDWSFSGPSRNEVNVGHAAAQRFLAARLRRRLCISWIPPTPGWNWRNTAWNERNC